MAQTDGQTDRQAERERCIKKTFVASDRKFHHGRHDSLLVSKQVTKLVHFTLQYYTPHIYISIF